jgi:hypothetical protein
VLLLVTVLLVLAGLVLLIIGFIQDTLSLIYLSIGCAAVAGVALIAFGRLSRRRALRLAINGGAIEFRAAGLGERETRVHEPVSVGEGSRPARQARDADAGSTEPQPAPKSRDESTEAARDAAARAAADRQLAASEPSWGAPTTEVAPVGNRSLAEPVGGAAGDRGGYPVADGDAADEEDLDEWGDEVVFPIEGYDDLRVGEIIPLLPDLEPDELEEVRDRESAGKNRNTIVLRIDELLGRTPAVTSARPAPGPAPTRPARPAQKASGPAERPAAKAAAAASTTARGKTGAANATPGPTKRAAASKTAAKAPAPAKRVAAATSVPTRRATTTTGPPPAPAGSKRAAAQATPATKRAAAKAAPAPDSAVAPAKRAGAKATATPAATKRAAAKAAPAPAAPQAPAERAAGEAAEAPPATKRAAAKATPAKPVAKKARDR